MKFILKFKGDLEVKLIYFSVWFFSAMVEWLELLNTKRVGT